MANTLDTTVDATVPKKPVVDPEKAHVILMLDSIYNTFMDITPRDTTAYFSSHPKDTKMVKGYLERAVEVGYEHSKLEFLQAIDSTCLPHS